jgi:site-specific DNA-methyltransferase (adenine-specific)
MEVLELNLKELKPYEENPRQKRDIEKVANSIKEYGWQQPIVVDKNFVIIAGHSRYEAAKMLQYEKAPVVVADISQEKAKAYRIADNKTNQYSDWDFSKLHKELGELLDVNYDLSNLGFEEAELESIITFDRGDKEWLDTEKEWEGMPSFEHDDLSPYMAIRVNFVNKEAVETFFKMIKQDYTEKTKYIWFPRIDKNVLKDKGYVTEE